MVESKESKPTDKNDNSTNNAISLGITFVIISSFLYLNPEFLGINLVSYIIGSVMGVVGFFGMVLVVDKLDKKFNEAINNIAISIFFGLIVYAIYYFFSNIIINIILLFLSIFVIFAFVSGVLQIVQVIVLEHDIKQSSIKISVFVLNLLIFILTILQILQIFKII